MILDIRPVQTILFRMWIWSKLSAAKWEDAWEERFHGHGGTNAVITHFANKKKIRVEVYCETESEVDAIQKQFGGSIRKLKQQNWAKLTHPVIPPIKIRERLLITGESESSKISALEKEFPKRRILSFPAEMAFGTGDHATTSTCLRFLADYEKEFQNFPEPWDLLDLGTGTGILALAALELGASRVHACDYDPHSVEIATKNAERNGLNGPNLHIFQQDVLEWTPKEKFTCVCANLFSTILEQAFPIIAQATKKGGHVIVSGILREQEQDVITAAENQGYVFDKVVRKGKWVTAHGILEAENRG